jgi:hypothetical protein
MIVLLVFSFFFSVPHVIRYLWQRDGIHRVGTHQSVLRHLEREW